MKNKRLVTFGVLAALVIACVISIVPNFGRQAEWKQIVSALQGLPQGRFEAAVQAFTRDRKASGHPLPDVVPLRELIIGGYLRTNDIRGLEEREVTVSLNAADETNPELILIRVRRADGSDIALLSDGSIQGLPSP